MPAGYEKIKQRLLKKGMPAKQAKKHAAMIWNSTHKGHNTVGKGRK
jgi:LDH2 family malate/lactate/ureidoglycolate dehydrogenase